MSKTAKKKKPTADEIAEMVMSEKDTAAAVEEPLLLDSGITFNGQWLFKLKY